jgi:cytochrome c-type biogenesis protein CcmH/NrfG
MAPRTALARLYLERGDLGSALAEMEEGLLSAPDARHVRCTMANLCIEAGLPLRAVDLAREELARDPRCSLAHLVLGRRYLTLAQYVPAITELEAAVAADPESGPTYLLLARVYRGSSLLDKAEAAARNAVQLAPDQSVCQLELALTLLERSDPRRTADALVAADRAVALDPAAIRARYALGLACQRAGRNQEAVREFERALQHRPSGYPEIHYALAQAYMSVGDVARARRQLAEYSRSKIERAVTDLRRLISERPPHPGLLWELGQLYEALGRPGDAVSVYRHLLKVNPRDRQALRALARLSAQLHREERAHYPARAAAGRMHGR